MLIDSAAKSFGPSGRTFKFPPCVLVFLSNAHCDLWQMERVPGRPRRRMKTFFGARGRCVIYDLAHGEFRCSRPYKCIIAICVS